MCRRAATGSARRAIPRLSSASRPEPSLRIPRLPLEKWLPVMWMVANCKNGVSSWEIHRALGVTQKTAWFMLHRIRLGMQEPERAAPLKFGGPDTEIEVDETFVGGKSKNMHREKRVRFVQGGRLSADNSEQDCCYGDP